MDAGSLYIGKLSALDLPDMEPRGALLAVRISLVLTVRLAVGSVRAGYVLLDDLVQNRAGVGHAVDF